MFLFKDKNEIEVPIKCKLCLTEVNFKITADEYREITKFPLQKEFIHGDPAHKLIIFLDKNMEVENFKIENVKQKEVSYSKELTREVLSDVGLNDEEIKLYFLTTGRDAVSLGEMAILIDKPKEDCKVIADKFVGKGLFKEIVGATPHYQALPPYAALVRQLQDFSGYINNIKTDAPKQLEESFSEMEQQTDGIKRFNEYTEFMDDLKNNTLKKMFEQKKVFDSTISDIEQIKGITDVIANLQNDTKVIMDKQIESLTEQFGDINKRINMMLAKQIEDLNEQFNNIKSRISDNLSKLRLGVVQQTVDQVIERVFSARLQKITEGLNKQLNTIQKAFADGLKKTTISFNTQFLGKLKKLIENVVQGVDGVTSNATKTSEDIKGIVADISKSFSQAVMMSEEKLEGISESIFESFGSLKDTFSTNVIFTLNDVLGNILGRLEKSEVTTNEFWEQAKSTSLFTMKDIWFIRSVESAIAHITDEVGKAKMRILIVAPEITDVDLTSLKARPSHINIRICAHINPSYPDHQEMLKELDKMSNITYRHRDLQHLWGINRDYEEVILCVISDTMIGNEVRTEIAGIGSIIPEHIKIFVPILEDAWVGAKKDIGFAIKPSMVGKAGARRLSLSQRARESAKAAPIAPKATGKKAPSPTAPTTSTTLAKAEPTPRPTKTSDILKAKGTLPEPSQPLPEPKDTPEPKQPQRVVQLKPTPKPAAKLKPVVQPPKVMTKPVAQPPQEVAKPAQPTPAAVSAPDASGLSGDELIKSQFDHLINNLDKLTGTAISNALVKLQADITEIRGYSAVLKQIGLSSNQLQPVAGILTKKERNELKKKMQFWGKKLNIK